MSSETSPRKASVLPAPAWDRGHGTRDARAHAPETPSVRACATGMGPHGVHCGVIYSGDGRPPPRCWEQPQRCDSGLAFDSVPSLGSRVHSGPGLTESRSSVHRETRPQGPGAGPHRVSVCGEGGGRVVGPHLGVTPGPRRPESSPLQPLGGGLAWVFDGELLPSVKSRASLGRGPSWAQPAVRARRARGPATPAAAGWGRGRAAGGPGWEISFYFFFCRKNKGFAQIAPWGRSRETRGVREFWLREDVLDEGSVFLPLFGRPQCARGWSLLSAVSLPLP